MATSSPLPAAAPQWADQIQRLCALLETLTYRVLEVEERLTALEARLDQAPAEATLAQEQALALQLEETTRRLARMEEALGGLEAQSALELLRPEGRASRRLQVLARSQPAAREAEGWQPDDESQEADPFFDEEEQSFLDESLESEAEAGQGDASQRRIA